MKYLYQLVRKYPITVILTIVIWYLSFFTPPQTRLEGIAFIDKWVHTTMYGGTFTVLWIEYLRKHKALDTKKLILLAWLAPILMSGLIEILQAYCTGGRRSGDWLDLAANAVGVTLAAGIGKIIHKLSVRWR